MNHKVTVSVTFMLYARFEVFAAVMIKFVIFWLVVPCSDVVGYQHFGGLCCLRLHP